MILLGSLLFSLYKRKLAKVYKAEQLYSNKIASLFHCEEALAMIIPYQRKGSKFNTLYSKVLQVKFGY